MSLGGSREGGDFPGGHVQRLGDRGGGDKGETMPGSSSSAGPPCRSGTTNIQHEVSICFILQSTVLYNSEL